MSRPVSRDQVESVAYFVLLVAATVASRMWFDNMHLFGRVRIDVALIFLAFLSIIRGVTFGIVAGALLGLIVDAINPAWMGASSVAFAAVGFFAGSFGQTLYMEKSVARGLLVIGAVVMFDIIFGMLSVGIGRPFGAAVLGTLGSAMISGLVALATSRLYRMWIRRATPEAENGGRD